jgi:hypothetical protein
MPCADVTPIVPGRLVDIKEESERLEVKAEEL